MSDQLEWQKIKDGCPTVWLELCKWAKAEFCTGWSHFIDPLIITTDGLEYAAHRTEYELFPTRALYDFFDSMNLMITVFDNAYADDAWEGHLRWRSAKEDEGVGLYKTRTEAEVAVFARAFEMLESDIKDGD